VKSKALFLSLLLFFSLNFINVYIRKSLIFSFTFAIVNYAIKPKTESSAEAMILGYCYVIEMTLL